MDAPQVINSSLLSYIHMLNVPEKPYDLNDAINIPTNAIEVVIKESFT
jgi:hypothetical protein